jgi:hypothetical protein
MLASQIEVVSGVASVNNVVDDSDLEDNDSGDDFDDAESGDIVDADFVTATDSNAVVATVAADPTTASSDVVVATVDADPSTASLSSAVIADGQADFPTDIIVNRNTCH